MDFRVFDLGLVDFNTALQFQKEIFAKVKDNLLSSGLILCQHHPVITLGRSSHLKNILVSEKELEAKVIPIYQAERAGDVTYHGPGQIVAYPIFNLNKFKKDIHLFLRYLEEIIICLLQDFGVKAERYGGLTGVWINQKKIASIGIAIRNWITFHGLSINIKKNDLDNFCLIRPCGMDIKMTSLESILGRNVETGEIKGKLVQKFRDVRLKGGNL